MTDRVLDISEEPARLSVRGGLLVVESGGEERLTVPFDELAAVVIGHRQVLLSQAVLSELAGAGALLVTCDAKYSPAAMVLPLQCHHAQAERFRRQAVLPLPKRKRLWQSVVRAKIRAQAAALERFGGSDHGLRAMALHVRSGDTSNVEARAARHYWTVLFPDAFHRSDDDDARNHLLNYGYAVLRATTARAICGAGLHPSFPLYHSNVHNPFGLADDLMELFRPLVDVEVRGIVPPELTVASKRHLIATLLARYHAEGEIRTLPDILVRVSQSLAGVVMGERDELWLPALFPMPSEVEEASRD